MNRTSASVITLAIILSMVATPAFRSSSNRGTGGTASKTEGKKGSQSSSRKSSSKQPQCKPANSFEEQLFGSIALAYMVNTDASGLSLGCTVPSKVKTEVMLAFVPDPRHTNLALLFDRQMDALQQGIQDAGWTFDQALMPWDSKEAPQFNDFVSNQLEQATVEAKEAEPGVLIFRRDGGDKLLVFVIGESPTGGIHKEQFGRTTGIITRLFGVNGPPVLGIFGPTFSGSLQSLAGLLQCTKEKSMLCRSTGQPIFEFSGTVSGRSAVDAVANPSMVQGLSFFKDNSNLIFATFQEYDDYAISRFLEFAVVNRHYCANEIAVLSEDESAYGSYQTGFKPINNSQSPKSETDDPATKHQEEIDPCGPKATTDQMVHLYFPREISQLRNAYQQSLAQAAQTNNIPGMTLPLDLQSSQNNDDTVAQYSQKQLPLSQEAVLLGISSELRYHNVKLVILRATDSLDQLFLARYLRGAYPQGRIVIFGTDLLFRREIQDSQLHGIMALSTYSLTPGSDHDFQGIGEVHVDRVFPSSDSVGTYNASKMLATVMEQQANCGFVRDSKHFNDKASSAAAVGSLPNTHLFQYAPPLSAGAADEKDSYPAAPPVHLTVLGHEGFAEITVLSASANHGSSLPQVTDDDTYTQVTDIIPKGWHLFSVLAVIVALAYCYFLLSASVLSSSEAVAHLAPPQKDSRNLLFATNSYLHFVFLLTVLWPFLYLNVPGFEASLEKWSLIVVMAAVSIIGACDLYRRSSVSMSAALLVACALTSAWVVYYTSPASVVETRRFAGYMFIDRAVQLTSGVSPLLPILFLIGAGLWGAWHGLSGSSLVDGRRPALPNTKAPEKDEDAPRYESILEREHEHLFELLRPNFMEGRAVVATIVIIAAIWWYARSQPLQTLEGSGYEYVLAVIITFLAIILVTGILRLQSIWTELRRLLIALDSLPIRRGFKKLEGFSWSPMWRIGAGSLAELQRLLSRQLESWRSLINLGVSDVETNSRAVFSAAIALRHAYRDAKSNYRGDSPIITRVDSSPEEPIPSVTPSAATVGAAAGAKLALEKPPRTTFWQGFIASLNGVRRWVAPFLPAWLKQALAQAGKDRTLIRKFTAFQQEFAKAGLHALEFCESEWNQATSIASNGTEKKASAKIAEAIEGQGRTPEEKAAAAAEEKRQDQLHACEEFVALLYTAFILIVLVRIRGLIVAAGGMYVLLLAAVNVYPFQPQVVIRTGLMILLVVIVGIVGFVYAQMHRDSTLSYITGTEPGELGLNFWIRIVSFVAVPAISLLASQFPQIAGLFSSWVEPAVNALK
jgi:hypothetical protein